MNSEISRNAIYEGSVAHHRHVDHARSFKYSVYMLWLKVSEIDDPNKKWPLISRNKWAALSVHAGDYMTHRGEDSLFGRLKGEIKDKLQKDWHGEAFALAQPRHLGFVMNPLAVYYCYGDNGHLDFVVGEITNTPWGERHCYVFDMSASSETHPTRFQFKKTFHVSPFLPMDMDYTWRLGHPGKNLVVNIWNKMSERLDFEAHLTLTRRKLSAYELILQMILKPLMTFKVLFGIYFQAAILYGIKRVRFYNHPKLTHGETQ